LVKLPRYVPAETTFLGKRFYVVDACTFLGGKKEIFDKNIYDFNSDTTSPYIIDCGANIGLSVIYFKSIFPNAKIKAFEPDQKIFETLKKNVDSFGLRDVEVFQEAIWTENGVIEFKIEGGFSGRIPKPDDLKGIVRVKSTRLKELLKESVDFLKIDIEGAEYAVLKDCVENLKNVKNIFIEYHSHISEKQILNEILEMLTETGFRYHIHEAYTRAKPYKDRELMLGMDLQLNIYGYR
jgi:FkbM family methyltransferase